jgi:hypothetical protein
MLYVHAMSIFGGNQRRCVQAQSKAMVAILKRMNTADEFEVVFFGDEVCNPGFLAPQICLRIPVTQDLAR